MSRRSFLHKPMPMKELRERLAALLLRRAKREWLLVAHLEVPDGKLFVFDPSYHFPNWVDPDHNYDLTLAGPPEPTSISIHLERIYEGHGYWRNASATITFADKPETAREKVGDVGVDSATLAIAIEPDLPSRWQVGGARSQSSVWIEFLEEEERIVEGRKAAELLSAKGFKMHSHNLGEWLWEFSDPLGDDEIEEANAALRAAQIRGYVNTVVHHSTELIHQQLKTKVVAVLDGESDPYLVAFESGFGDGVYAWFVLKNGDETIGFCCEMI